MIEYTLTNSKLQHIYDRHAPDFGITDPKSVHTLTALSEAIHRHLTAPDSLRVQGQYRGSWAILVLEQVSGIVVVLDQSNNVVAGWKTSTAQAAYILTKQRLN